MQASVQKKLSTPDYVPIGYDRDLGDYVGPLHPASGQRMEGQAAKDWWASQKFFYLGRSDGSGRVRHFRPQRDAHGDMKCFTTLPPNTPEFDMKVANAIKKAMSEGLRGIDALLKYVHASKLQPDWLRANGADEKFIPTTQAFELAQMEKTIAKLESLGATIPKKIKASMQLATESVSPAPAPVEDEEIEETIDGLHELNEGDNTI
jgi:hypothetical protein